ncbi:TIGR03016 family PEP-CTERM system-associated outer membrane protein [Massilia sp. PAMC28688]|uniref:TIGR03016 family PEP-CTERM system-associated outer membrane protein n=1 Tax=Massilia sp. PAMC28688 TaxID=2861283 RepID=UPI001C625A4D|nr:TIGR03016 family PEP-CTERM system-associated outer membrane protein [Massilia sp. PAMC28688]QYF95056.1 TIGR03016 family PEP-CTERM system-associated outer membrane protein [Massilia sp. PAMC28688]
MIITTAKPMQRVAGRQGLRLAPLAFAALLCASARAQLIEQPKPAPEADQPSTARWRFIPTLDLRTILTDNVALAPGARAHGQLITEISPGFRANFNTPRIKGYANYNLRMFSELRDRRAGARRNAHSLNANGRAELVNDMIFVDGYAAITQVGISPFGQTPNGYSSANTADVKTWRISPSMLNRFGNFAVSELRYTKDGVSAARTGLGDTVGDTASVSVRNGRGWQDLGFDLNASNQVIRDKLRNDTHVKTGNFNLNYQLFDTLAITAGRNYDSYDYESLGGANSGNGWNAGFTWTPSRRTSLTVNNGQRYYGPSRVVKAFHRSRRTVWSVTYDDSVTSTRGNFLLPSTVDTAFLLNNLLLPTFPDPLERANAIEEYMRATGLPLSLPDKINFFSNRFSLQKQLRASVAVRGARTNVVLTAFRSRREALSTSVVDSVLQGTSTSNQLDNVDQAGVSTAFNYRLTPLTSLNVRGEVTHNESLTTALKTSTGSLRFGARHRLDRKAHATIELRHVRGNASFTEKIPYTENAITAYLTIQL